MRRPPKSTWISSTLAAWMLIWLTRHRLPCASRLFLYFIGCDIGPALPNTLFLPLPLGIVIQSALE